MCVCVCVRACACLRVCVRVCPGAQEQGSGSRFGRLGPGLEVPHGGQPLRPAGCFFGSWNPLMLACLHTRPVRAGGPGQGRREGGAQECLLFLRPRGPCSLPRSGTAAGSGAGGRPRASSRRQWSPGGVRGGGLRCALQRLQVRLCLKHGALRREAACPPGSCSHLTKTRSA